MASGVGNEIASTPSRIVGNYKLLHRIGSGSFATVWKAELLNRIDASSPKEFAIKVINLQKFNINNATNNKYKISIEKEINIMKTLDHSNIIKLYETITNRNYLYIVLEYCDKSDLYHYIYNNALSEYDIRLLLIQLVNGLKYLYDFNLIHRDLKPQNILLTSSLTPYDYNSYIIESNSSSPVVSYMTESNKITLDPKNKIYRILLKIADFGFARVLPTETSLASTLCGSPLYMAPEILKYQMYNYKVDLWSIGCILYEMVARSPPFTAQNHIQLLHEIENNELRFPINISISNPLLSLIKSLLKRNPLERMSFNDLYSHPFIRGSIALSIYNSFSNSETNINEVKETTTSEDEIQKQQITKPYTQPFRDRKFSNPQTPQENSNTIRPDPLLDNDFIFVDNLGRSLSTQADQKIILSPLSIHPVDGNMKEKINHLLIFSKIIEQCISILFVAPAISNLTNDLLSPNSNNDNDTSGFLPNPSTSISSPSNRQFIILSLYARLIDTYSNIISNIKSANKEAELSSILNYSIDKYKYYYDKSSVIMDTINTKNSSSTVPCIEKILYDFAMRLAHDGIIEEGLKHTDNAIKYFQSSYRLLQELSYGSSDNSDINILHHYMSILIKRIDNLKKR